MEFISDNLTTIVIALIGILAVGITLKVVINKGGNNKSIQKNNDVGGNMSGRDTNIDSKND